MNQRAGRALRLRRTQDIRRVFADGVRASDGLLTVRAARRADGSGPARMGVAVSTRHGKAVRRNRIKRLCREAFRLVRAELPAGWDFMLIPRLGAEPTLGAFQSSIRKLAARVVGAAERQDRP